MTGKKTARAAQKARRKATVVENVRLDRMPMKTNQPCHPIARFKGDVPKPGDLLEFTLANDVTYVGTVSDATEVDGEVIAEFKDGLAPLPSK